MTKKLKLTLKKDKKKKINISKLKKKKKKINLSCVNEQFFVFYN